MNLIDTHAHLNDAAFDADLNDVIDRVRQRGIRSVINVSEGVESCEKSLQQADQYPELFCTIGVHPHKAAEVTEEDFQKLKLLSVSPKVKAVGEIGLDFYYDYAPREIQKQVFTQFLKLGLEINLPVIIHCRDAEKEMEEIFRVLGHQSWRGVIHCFTGSHEFAQKMLDLGFYISFSGIITFKNANALRDVVARIPLERMLVETDSPYLTPVPYRGKRNEPVHVLYVAQQIAEIKNLSIDEIMRITTINAIQLFSLE